MWIQEHEGVFNFFVQERRLECGSTVVPESHAIILTKEVWVIRPIALSRGKASFVRDGKLYMRTGMEILRVEFQLPKYMHLAFFNVVADDGPLGVL